MAFSRRAFVGIGAALTTGAAFASFDANPRDLLIEGRRALWITPNNVRQSPLVVLLHGLGETGNAKAGAYAWWDRYGLRSACDRLSSPPVSRITKFPYFTDDALAIVNEKLRLRPFGPLSFFCPHVPNAQTPAQAKQFATWLVQRALPNLRDRGVAFSKTMLAGCSLGAFIAFETFAAFPEAFSAIAGVQSAISTRSQDRYAEIFANAKLRGEQIYLSTSSGDPYRAPTRALVSTLEAKGLAPFFHEAPGPHDQPWLAEVGTVELLMALSR